MPDMGIPGARGMQVSVSPGHEVGPDGITMVAGANVSTRLTALVIGSVSVLVQALPGNTDDIYVGGGNAGIGTGGAFLSARESIVINVDFVERIYIRSASAGQGVTWFVVR